VFISCDLFVFFFFGFSGPHLGKFVFDLCGLEEEDSFCLVQLPMIPIFPPPKFGETEVEFVLEKKSNLSVLISAANLY
jgi:hypothetical protein